MQEKIFSVTQINREAKRSLEGNFSGIIVGGEVSQSIVSAAGHCYFTLKDMQGSTIPAVIFRGAAARNRGYPEEGKEIEVRGSLTVYEKTGKYQIIVDRFRLKGAGVLAERFEELKRKLEAEGLFSNDHKKPLPKLPAKICLVTSPTSAAVQDMIKNILQRFPNREISVIPVAVQGKGSENEIAKGIQFADSLNYDVIIVGRGGGSLEDLWSFNEEVVARAIFHCNTPIVSAVGHEVDFSISDFVADIRATTPTQAAELIVPQKADLVNDIRLKQNRLYQNLKNHVRNKRQKLEYLENQRFLRNPRLLISSRFQLLDELTVELKKAVLREVQTKQKTVLHLNEKLQLKNPGKVMKERKRGLDSLAEKLVRNQHRLLELKLLKNQRLFDELKGVKLDRMIVRQRKDLLQKTTDLRQGIHEVLEGKKTDFQLNIEKLEIMSPLKQLSKGYSILRGEEREIIKSVKNVSINQKVQIEVSDGRIHCAVESTEKRKKA